MHLVQLLLPIPAGDGGPGMAEQFARVRRELTEKFGGLTAYMRAPATGLWKDETGTLDRDEVVMVEVVVEHLDRQWWAGYRRRLEERFRQKEILLRALPIERL